MTSNVNGKTSLSRSFAHNFSCDIPSPLANLNCESSLSLEGHNLGQAESEAKEAQGTSNEENYFGPQPHPATSEEHAVIQTFKPRMS